MINFRHLMHSVTAYLSYQHWIGRNFMLSESSLKYPVADYLSGLNTSLSQIHLEYPHPFLARRQVDLIITDSTASKIETAIEFKVIKNYTTSTAEKERIFNDLLRLHLLAKNGKSDCYIIIAGEYPKFIQKFRSIPDQKPMANIAGLPEPKGFYTEWFGFEESEVKTFDVKLSLNADYRSVYQAFSEDFKSRDIMLPLDLPEILTTRCIEISALSRKNPAPFVGGIWKVE